MLWFCCILELSDFEGSFRLQKVIKNSWEWRFPEKNRRTFQWYVGCLSSLPRNEMRHPVPWFAQPWWLGGQLWGESFKFVRGFDPQKNLARYTVFYRLNNNSQMAFVLSLHLESLASASSFNQPWCNFNSYCPLQACPMCEDSVTMVQVGPSRTCCINTFVCQ